MCVAKYLIVFHVQFDRDMDIKADISFKTNQSMIHCQTYPISKISNGSKRWDFYKVSKSLTYSHKWYI